ncbi:ATP-binding protein [Achromobacter marplatensis]|jgi:two-component system sensor histidine kinase QseC|uniref:histidine kinase n=1 Tax=Achromobacter marplatensis TaxID=470868 RepID=A0AA42WCP6_9BURK|nr:ATP-binding protein [Achromobacter marplatensis]EJO32409.1 sensor protein QseC [Achromobacter marplatensis]MDH2052043.1 ATP-binding protein [Achromobacter marplatensis]
MTLQRRLIIAVLLAAPLAWLITIAGTYWRASHEINELYDTDMLRLAQQTLAISALIPPSAPLLPTPAQTPSSVDSGDAGLGDLSVAIWRGADIPLVLDAEALQFPRAGDRTGFLESVVSGEPWRLVYLSSPDGKMRVAVGQRIGERHDLVVAYIAGQILPWLVGLPVLIGLLIFAVRRAMRPVRALSMQLEQRSPDDATPIPSADVPGELKALLNAMNGLLARVGKLIEQERRLTADAAHELRTPLAAVRAQWDVVQRTEDPTERLQAQASVTRGMERLDRLVLQLLTMARLDSASHADFGGSVDWRAVAEQAVGDCLWIANRRDVDIAVEWPDAGVLPLPIAGDEDALTIMLKNLLDNAIRYGPRHAQVRVAFQPSRVVIDDQGSGIDPDVLPRLGGRFVRAAGNEEAGSGLGVSIAHRIAQIHGLNIRFTMRDPTSDLGPGLQITLRRGA